MAGDDWRSIGQTSEMPAERDGDAWVLQDEEREVRLTNLTKAYWPAAGGSAEVTKGDLCEYYWNAAPWILPHTADRPLTLHRMPEGVAGEGFYEKRAPGHTPEWVARCRMPASERSGRGETEYLLARRRSDLLWLANLGCIEIHPLHSRFWRLDRPDYAFFDLDPNEVGFEDVRAVALVLGDVLGELGLVSYPKTSGATGLQIFLPLDGRHDYAEVRGFVTAVGGLLAAAYPEKVTMTVEVARRGSRVFVDANMNRRGQNIAGVYCVRPVPGACVSTPLTWDEVAAGAVPQDFRIDNVLARVQERGDLFAPVQSGEGNLDAAMARLGLDLPAARRRALHGDGRHLDPDSVHKAGLGAYDTRRDAAKTPEPLPSGEGAGVRPAWAPPGPFFVIQQHYATRLHHDVRFEAGGALVSWAVPRGLPPEPGERRLAVPTEDHPLAYADFTGEIPAGEYGAGAVRRYDAGPYELLEADAEKWTVRLHGHRETGEFHFVRTKGSQGLVLRSAACPPAAVVLPPVVRPARWAAGPGVPGARPGPERGWRFEPLWPGRRVLVECVYQGPGRVYDGSGADVTGAHPGLVRIGDRVVGRTALLDGVVAGETLVVLDLPFHDGEDLTERPLVERLARLGEAVVPDGTRVRLNVGADGDPGPLQEALGAAGESVPFLSRRLDSPYRYGVASRAWRLLGVT